MSARREGYRGVVWLDRDGTLVDDPGYLDDPAKLMLLAGAADAIAELNRQGVAVVLITNQSGIARGLMTRETVDGIHRALKNELQGHGAQLAGIYLCPHLPPELMSPEGEPCGCRKPRPDLVLRATKELGLAGLPGIVVGDKRADLELGAGLGIPSLLVRTGEGEKTLDEFGADGVEVPLSAKDLRTALPLILQTLGIAP